MPESHNPHLTSKFIRHVRGQIYEDQNYESLVTFMDQMKYTVHEEMNTNRLSTRNSKIPKGQTEIVSRKTDKTIANNEYCFA